MRRSDRAQDRQFTLSLIDRCTHGVMAISTGEDTPYCIPLSFVRVGDDLFFHCAAQGRKLELLRRCSKVCVTFVGDDRPHFQPPAMYSTWFQSAVVTGTASEVLDPGEKREALRALCRKLTPDHMDSFDAAMEKSLSVTSVWRVQMEEVSGKAKLEPRA